VKPAFTAPAFDADILADACPHTASSRLGSWRPSTAQIARLCGQHSHSRFAAAADHNGG
jgi:hypothetical protein